MAKTGRGTTARRNRNTVRNSREMYVQGNAVKRLQEVPQRTDLPEIQERRRLAQKRKQKDIHGHDPDVLHVCRHLLLSWSADLRQPRQELADRRHLRRSGCSVCSSVH